MRVRTLLATEEAVALAALLVAVSLLGFACAGARDAAKHVGLGAREGEVYYVGADRLPVHEAPGASSSVVGWLARHEKLTRTRVEHGYARIHAEARGISGWVDNAQLISRLPPAAAPPGDPPPTTPQTRPRSFDPF